jgi:hypothetical protein
VPLQRGEGEGFRRAETCEQVRRLAGRIVRIIVIAALLNIGVLHFSAHPRHIVYLATYVVVMVGAVLILWR